MTITELIAALEAVRAEHGDQVHMAIYRDGDCERMGDTRPPTVREMWVHGLYRRAYVEPDDPHATGPAVQVLAL